MKKLTFILILVSSVLPILAQQPSHKATISTVKESGLYKIELTPSVKQYMQHNLQDLRILNADNKELPYVLLSEPLLKAKSDFVSYEIVSQKHFNANSGIHLHWRSNYAYSEIIVKNSAKESISNIAFNINNSDAYKYCAIEGSDDMKQWYSVSEKQELSLAYNDVYANQYKCIYFPLTNYQYYRLLVEDWDAQPLKINTAGCFKNSVIAGKLNNLLFIKTITEDAKNKTSTIKLSFTNNQQVDRIDFKIKEPRLFKRQAIIYTYQTVINKKNVEQVKKILVDFELSSDNSLFFDLPSINESTLYIEIQNKDNPPLQIDSLSCKQLASYIICDFKANQNYSLVCGDSTLKLPEYDLIHFVSQIPQLMPQANYTDFKALEKVPVPSVSEKEKSFFETKTFMWLCIGIGGIILLFFSKSLLSDMSKKDE